MKKTIKECVKDLKLWIPALFLALKEKETPIGAKILAGLTVGYALSPIDLVPDFIPVLGYLDDIIILPLMVSLTIKFIPENVMDKCKLKAESMWSDGKPKRWYYAVPIIVIWVLIIYLILKAIVR